MSAEGLPQESELEGWLGMGGVQGHGEEEVSLGSRLGHGQMGGDRHCCGLWAAGCGMRHVPYLKW